MISSISITAPEDPRRAPEERKAHHPASSCKAFQNPWPSFENPPAPGAFLKAKLRGDKVFTDTIPPNITELVGIETPTWETGDKTKIKALWLGHASFYIELPCKEDQERGLRLLFDPVFSERCSPVSYAGPKRSIQPPTTVDGLPDIDFVCISHNHYDHLDEATIKALHKRFNNKIHFFVPLRVAETLISWKINNVTELDWWEEKIFRKDDLEARVGYLPAQHSSGRGIFDQAKSLWGSYSVESTSHPDKRIWFSGDTGRRSVPREIEMKLPETQEELDKLPVCPAHKQIGDFRGPFSLAMIPIGAYKPRYLFSSVHIDPIEAISIFEEVRAERAVGMHWGIFCLTAEELMEPREELEKLCKEKGINAFETWKLGNRTEI